MSIITCPCCNGSGTVESDGPLEVLSPMQRQIYEAVRDNAGKLGCERLITLIYGGRYDGGPDFPWDSIHVTVHNMNKRLARFGQRLDATRRGPGATYRIRSV